MKQHGTAWNCMKQHGKHDFNIFMLHGTAWNCMKLHKNTSISYISMLHAHSISLESSLKNKCTYQNSLKVCKENSAEHGLSHKNMNIPHVPGRVY
jgi:hypothetical protein